MFRSSAELPSVGVVIVSYNTAKLTVQAIDSVLESQDVRPEITVVDNASTDRTLATLKRKYGLKLNRGAHRLWQNSVGTSQVLDRFPSLSRDRAVITEILTGTVGNAHIRVLLSQENLGFGRANNLGMADLQSDHVFLLNSDATVNPKTLKTLRRHFTALPAEPSSVLLRSRNKLDNLGILAADLRYPDGSVQRQGGALPTLGNVFRWIFFVDDLPFVANVAASYQHHESDMRSLRRRPITKVGWVGGTAMMLSRSCLEEVGGFDESLFMYGEDVELCLRATKRHWDIAISSQALVKHVGSASAGSKNALHGEITGLIQIWTKHHSPQELWVLKRILRFGLRLRVLTFGILRRYGQQRIYKEALELVR